MSARIEPQGAVSVPASAPVSSAVVVGGGNMGEALLGVLLSQNEGPFSELSSENVIVANPVSERNEYLTSRYGVSCVSNASRVAQEAQLVVLAVKPQVMDEALRQVREGGLLADGRSPLFLTVAAGLPCAFYESRLPQGTRVVRAMPNTPLLVGAGATGVCAGACATSQDLALALALFSSAGLAVSVPESQIDAVCALSGSGPGYVDAFIEALRDGGVKAGLEPSVAQLLAIQTVLGAATLLQQTGTSPEDARRAVCSPGGTTLAGLNAMQAAGFTSAVEAAVDAANRRSKELSAS